MTRTMALLLVMGCTGSGPSDTNTPPTTQGTFVGNPSLTARYIAEDVDAARGGRLMASEIFLEHCDDDDNTLIGQAAFEFMGSDSLDFVQVPANHYCEVFLVVQELTVAFLDNGDEYTVTATNFDLRIPTDFIAEDGATYSLELGGPTWLSGIADATQPGATDIVDDDDLADAFLGPLRESTQVQTSEPPIPDEPLEGFLDLDEYPLSPNSWPSVQADCGPSVLFEMAVPIPPATMAAYGLGTEVGWCEGSMQFNDDLAPIESIQVDYSDLSAVTIEYNGWGSGCDELHCNTVVDGAGDSLGLPCTVLISCDGPGGIATAVGVSL